MNDTSENGYILYFSDHRGKLTDPNASNGGQTPAGVISGESGLEDVINSAQPLTSTTQDGALEATTYYTYSPEDVDQNGKLDNWGGQTLYYNGSLVSMYYSEYNTSVFKCCNTVYSPPTRSYAFDTLFLNPANLPPGTPMFQDVVNPSYHQNFTPQ